MHAPAKPTYITAREQIDDDHDPGISGCVVRRPVTHDKVGRSVARLLGAFPSPEGEGGREAG